MTVDPIYYGIPRPVNAKSAGGMSMRTRVGLLVTSPLPSTSSKLVDLGTAQECKLTSKRRRRKWHTRQGRLQTRPELVHHAPIARSTTLATMPVGSVLEVRVQRKRDWLGRAKWIWRR
jgi:hypothetical protein